MYTFRALLHDHYCWRNGFRRPAAEGDYRLLYLDSQHRLLRFAAFRILFWPGCHRRPSARCPDQYRRHCPGRPVLPGLLDQDQPAGDRGVADDHLQSQVVYTVLKDKVPAGSTVVIFYDSGDSYTDDFKTALMALDDGTFTMVAKDHPISLAMDDAAIEALVADYGTLSPAPQGLVSIGLAASAGKTMNASSSSFTGTLVVTDGQISDTFFDGRGADFITWLNNDANQVVGTTPYYEPEGDNTGAWVDRLGSLTGGATAGPDNAFTPMMADCLYQIALAHMVGSKGGEADAVEAVYAGMQSFKVAASEVGTRTAVAPTSAGMTAAKAAIDAGDSVYLNGSSGPLLFSDVGDRHYSMQVYATLSIANDGIAYSWALDSLWRGLEP